MPQVFSYHIMLQVAEFDEDDDEIMDPEEDLEIAQVSFVNLHLISRSSTFQRGCVVVGGLGS